METYAQVLNYAIPFFVILILIESVIGRQMGRKVNRGADTISSLSSGVTNVLKDVLGLSVVIISYDWLVDKVALVELSVNWVWYVAGFIALDLAGYWMHRFNHEINFLWNRHIIHHSSEEFNLSCALRQSISTIFSFFNILLLPAALLGVPTQVIAVIAPIHLFAQFWYHTRLIDKMGWLETFLVTPSHHRVHHAINTEYLDKNYSEVFIVWDKLFGTFQPELEAVPPVYGVKRPVRTWNPFLINFQHIALLARDAWYTRNWWDKIRIWFMPTGWRPADVAAKYPVQGVTDVYKLEKYETYPSRKLLIWSWAQLAITVAFMFYLFNNIGDLAFVEILLYGLFLFAGVFSLTTLLDKSRYALLTEVVKSAFGLSLFWWQGGWFGLGEMWGYVVVGYLLVAPLVVMYFRKEMILDPPSVLPLREGGFSSQLD